MEFKVAFLLSISSTATFGLHLFLVISMIILGQYTMLFATIGLIVLNSIVLLYFYKVDNFYQNNRVLYWFLSLLQIEVVYVILKKDIPMSTMNYFGYKAFVEYTYAVFNVIFLFLLQSYEIENTYDLGINGYTILLLRFYQFSIYLILYFRFQYNTFYTLSDGIEAFAIYSSFYLMLGALLTKEVGEYKCNLGQISLTLLLITSIISLCLNARQIRDSDQHKQWINKFIYSLICNSHPYQVCTYGRKQPSIVCSFITQFTMIILLIVFFSQSTYKDLSNFYDLSQNKKVMAVNVIIAVLLNCYYLAKFQYQFFFNSLRLKSSYVSSDEDLVAVSNDLKSSTLLLSEVDIQFKLNYQPQQEASLPQEEIGLVENKCNVEGCKIQFEFLKSISHVLKDKVSINLHQKDFNLCDLHIEELLSSQEYVEPNFIGKLLKNNDFKNSRIPIEIIKERFTNGFITSELTQTIIKELPKNKQDILKKMNSQIYQIFGFLKHQQKQVTVLPGLVLFDLYSIDA